MLSQKEVLDEFRAAGALLEGHFILSSGLHSSRYLQCARVLMDPKRAERKNIAGPCASGLSKRGSIRRNARDIRIVRSIDNCMNRVTAGCHRRADAD